MVVRTPLSLEFGVNQDVFTDVDNFDKVTLYKSSSAVLLPLGECSDALTNNQVSPHRSKSNSLHATASALSSESCSNILNFHEVRSVQDKQDKQSLASFSRYLHWPGIVRKNLEHARFPNGFGLKIKERLSPSPSKACSLPSGSLEYCKCGCCPADDDDDYDEGLTNEGKRPTAVDIPAKTDESNDKIVLPYKGLGSMSGSEHFYEDSSTLHENKVVGSYDSKENESAKPKETFTSNQRIYRAPTTFESSQLENSSEPKARSKSSVSRNVNMVTEKSPKKKWFKQANSVPKVEFHRKAIPAPSYKFRSSKSLEAKSRQTTQKSFETQKPVDGVKFENEEFPRKGYKIPPKSELPNEKSSFSGNIDLSIETEKSPAKKWLIQDKTVPKIEFHRKASPEPAYLFKSPKPLNSESEQPSPKSFESEKAVGTIQFKDEEFPRKGYILPEKSELSMKETEKELFLSKGPEKTGRITNSPTNEMSYKKKETQISSVSSSSNDSNGLVKPSKVSKEDFMKVELNGNGYFTAWHHDWCFNFLGFLDSSMGISGSEDIGPKSTPPINEEKKQIKAPEASPSPKRARKLSTYSNNLESKHSPQESLIHAKSPSKNAEKERKAYKKSNTKKESKNITQSPKTVDNSSKSEISGNCYKNQSPTPVKECSNSASSLKLSEQSDDEDNDDILVPKPGWSSTPFNLYGMIQCGKKLVNSVKAGSNWPRTTFETMEDLEW